MSALEQAARAVLARWDSPQWDWNAEGPTADLMHALRAALDAGQVQPVAYRIRYRHIEKSHIDHGDDFGPWHIHNHFDVPNPLRGIDSMGYEYEAVPLYASPPARQPLAADKHKPHAVNVPGYKWVDVLAVRAIERAHGIT